MAFGLCNTRATFKRLMRHLLDPLIQLFVIAYLDDICLYSKEPSCIGREALVGGTGDARGGCQMLPRLFMVGASNSCDPGPVGLGRRLIGVHKGGCAARSGWRSGGAAATTRVLLNTARPDGIDLRKG